MTGEGVRRASKKTSRDSRSSHDAIAPPGDSPGGPSAAVRAQFTGFNRFSSGPVACACPGVGQGAAQSARRGSVPFESESTLLSSPFLPSPTSLGRRRRPALHRFFLFRFHPPTAMDASAPTAVHHAVLQLLMVRRLAPPHARPPARAIRVLCRRCRTHPHPLPALLLPRRPVGGRRLRRRSAFCAWGTRSSSQVRRRPFVRRCRRRDARPPASLSRGSLVPCIVQRGGWRGSARAWRC